MGAVVGFERDRNGRAAGLRTQLLVCVGTALFMIVSLVLAEVGGMPGDPGRVAAQVVTGIGFLGAGVILKQGITVRGLTTAACLWVTAAIGMAAGGGMYLVAAATCGLTVLTLVGLKAFETTFARDTYRRVTLVTGIDVDADLIQDITRPRASRSSRSTWTAITAPPPSPRTSPCTSTTGAPRKRSLRSSSKPTRRPISRSRASPGGGKLPSPQPAQDFAVRQGTAERRGETVHRGTASP